MAKKPENIKKQKEQELKKKRKALEKRQKERAKYDAAYAEKMKDTLEKKENEKNQEKEALLNKLTSPLICIPVLSLFCFGVLCLLSYLNGYKIFSPEFRVSGLFHCLYAGDLSIGLSSRLLVGTVLSLFTDTLSAQSIDAFAKAFLYISFALQSVFTAFVMRKGIKDKSFFMLILSLIFTVSPFIANAYSFSAFFGILDLYNYVIFIAGVFIAIKGRVSMQFILPVLSITGLLIHYSYFMAFFPAIFVLSLYRTVNSEERQLKKEAAALGINSAVSVIGFFYLTLLAKNFLIMNSEEMLTYVHSKVDSTVFIYDNYLMYYIYDIFLGTQMTDASSSLTALVNINGELRNTDTTVKYLLFTALILIIFWAINAYLIRTEKGKRRLPFIAACVMPLALIPELILSSDSRRWVVSTSLCIFYVLFAFYLMKVPALTDLLEKLKKAKPAIKIPLTAVLFAYFVFCFFFERIIY